MNVIRHLRWLTPGAFLSVVVGLCSSSFALEAAPSMPSSKPALPAVGSVNSTAAAKLDWLQSFVQASRLARQQDKVILAYFCGSDWCAWCQKLDKEVLT